MKNYYQLLKIEPDANLNTIKRAFRKEIARYHPHNNKSPEAEAIFDDLVEGFDILSDQDKRKTYNELLNASLKEQYVMAAPKPKETYQEWQNSSKKKAKKYRSFPLEELLLLDIFVSTNVLDDLLADTDTLLDGLGESLGDVFDLF